MSGTAVARLYLRSSYAMSDTDIGSPGSFWLSTGVKRCDLLSSYACATRCPVPAQATRLPAAYSLSSYAHLGRCRRPRLSRTRAPVPRYQYGAVPRYAHGAVPGKQYRSAGGASGW
eukprot:1487446-Rhodomonas_salina.1